MPGCARACGCTHAAACARAHVVCARLRARAPLGFRWLDGALIGLCHRIGLQKLKELRQLSDGAELIQQQKEYGQEYEKLHGTWAEYEHQANVERTRRDHVQEKAAQAREDEARYDADANATMVLSQGQAGLEEQHLQMAQQLQVQAEALAAASKQLQLEEAAAKNVTSSDNMAALRAVRTLDHR